MPLEVRWGDMDAFGHVNSGAYLAYLEEARVRWMDSVPSHWQSDETGPVVANISLNYRHAIHWPAEIEVTLKALSPGRSSIKLEHEIRAQVNPPEENPGQGTRCMPMPPSRWSGLTRTAAIPCRFPARSANLRPKIEPVARSRAHGGMTWLNPSIDGRQVVSGWPAWLGRTSPQRMHRY